MEIKNKWLQSIWFTWFGTNLIGFFILFLFPNSFPMFFLVRYICPPFLSPVFIYFFNPTSFLSTFTVYSCILIIVFILLMIFIDKNFDNKKYQGIKRIFMNILGIVLISFAFQFVIFGLAMVSIH